MKIIFSSHALAKMGQRHISRLLVRETVVNANFVRPSYGLREERYKKFGQNYLKTVVKIEDKQIVVITAHWIAKVKDK